MSTPTSAAPAAPYARELIEKEIEHLKKGRSVRHGTETRRGGPHWLIVAFVLGLGWLYTMDVFLFSYHRGDAIRTYLYLHNYGADRQAAAVAGCGLLTPHEVQVLNHRTGAFQDYFNGTKAADEKAGLLIAYMKDLQALHRGQYADLSPLNKLRYTLFMKLGCTLPIRWDVLNSALDN